MTQRCGEIFGGFSGKIGEKMGRDSGKWVREVVGISGFVVSMVWERFMVLGSCFGCLEVFGSDGAALLKKEVPKVERDL